MTQTLKLPNKVIKSDWQDDIDYEPYANEKTYISPTKVTRATINRIKASSIKLTLDGLFTLK